MGNADQLPAPDDVLAGKYRIERVLGQGGMGIVLAAMHLQLEERVAIKFLLPELAHDPMIVARFLREGRAAIKIRSEHVVRVLDVGTLAGGTPYLVMEHLQGINFEELLEQQGPLPFDLAVDHVLQATEALAEAHALGMVHRDVKPANLFLVHRADGSPSVKVLDFGITKVADTAGASDLETTKATEVMGSPRYMSPEQMRSARTIDARADIWALGVILQELITGSAPFDGETMPDLLAAILQDSPLPLSELRPDVPQGLDAVVLKCLEKEASARYADVAELTQALAPFGSESARVSAERVARVIRPVPGGMIRSSVLPPPRSLPPVSANSMPPPPPEPPPSASGSVTVSATANAWGATGGGTRSAARTVGFVVASLFFSAVLILPIFGTGVRRRPVPLTRPAAAANGAPMQQAPLPTPPLPALVPVESPAPAIESPRLGAPKVAPDPAPSAATPPSSTKRRAASAPKRRETTPAPVAQTPAAPPASSDESNLFDGRK